MEEWRKPATSSGVMLLNFPGDASVQEIFITQKLCLDLMMETPAKSEPSVKPLQKQAVYAATSYESSINVEQSKGNSNLKRGKKHKRAAIKWHFTQEEIWRLRFFSKLEKMQEKLKLGLL